MNVFLRIETYLTELWMCRTAEKCEYFIRNTQNEMKTVNKTEMGIESVTNITQNYFSQKNNQNAIVVAVVAVIVALFQSFHIVL